MQPIFNVVKGTELFEYKEVNEVLFSQEPLLSGERIEFVF